jgi:hypothetical protein
VPDRLPSGDVECTAASALGSTTTPNEPCCSVAGSADSVVCSCCTLSVVVDVFWVGAAFSGDGGDGGDTAFAFRVGE